MLVFVPHNTFEECANILHPSDAVSTCLAALEVAAVSHKLHNYTDKLQEHPTVLAWKGYEALLLSYGMLLWEHTEKVADMEKLPKVVHGVRDQLSDALEIATSGKFEMNMPRWWGTKLVHLSSLSFVVTAHPLWYPEQLGLVPLGLPLWIPIS